MLHDITPPISPALAVFPGDTPPTREILLDMAKGDSLTLSTLRATVHLGAHADAPSHYGREAPSIERVPLDRYLGPCQVIRVDLPPGARIRAADLPVPIAEERVLFATGSFPDPRVFRQDFVALDPDLVDFLHGRGVRLVGIDTPSVDPAASKELPAHNRILLREMAILEGLVLDGVPVGTYELIALPLPLVGFDASPVRAILRG
jgi:arylformamidase